MSGYSKTAFTRSAFARSFFDAERSEFVGRTGAYGDFQKDSTKGSGLLKDAAIGLRSNGCVIDGRSACSESTFYAQARRRAANQEES
jgi:hypothetical protein